jgi:hypothetical protein
MSVNRTPEVMMAAIAAAVLLTGCAPEAARSVAAEGPAPHVTEELDGTASIDSWITDKNHYPAKALSADQDRWEFCFDSADGGWTCLPVSAADYARFAPGDRVQVRQQVGKIAVVSSR